MKVRDVLRIVENDGWYKVTQKGSHRQFKNPSVDIDPSLLKAERVNVMIPRNLLGRIDAVAGSGNRSVFLSRLRKNVLRANPTAAGSRIGRLIYPALYA